MGNGDAARANEPAMRRSDPAADPWFALMQEGTRIVTALAAVNDPKASAHP
jgi:hypothetical protein